MFTRMVRIGDGQDGASGRWRLNAGSPMVLTVPALRPEAEGPVRVIADLASLRLASDRVVALLSHDENRVAGFFHRPSSSSEGFDADLSFVVPRTDREAMVMGDVVRAKALVDQGVPLQVSIGAAPGDDGCYEPVQPGSMTINGRTYDVPNDGIPTFILRGGVIDEGSILPFGADAHTGRIAAHRTHRSQPIMNLKTLLAKHDARYRNVIAKAYEDAEGKTDAEIQCAADEAIRQFDMDDRDKQIADLKASLKAAQDKVSELEAKMKADGSTAQDQLMASRGSLQGIWFQAGGGNANTPKNGVEAMAAIRAADPKLCGLALHAEARRQYPTLFKSVVT